MSDKTLPVINSPINPIDRASSTLMAFSPKQYRNFNSTSMFNSPQGSTTNLKKKLPNITNYNKVFTSPRSRSKL